MGIEFSVYYCHFHKFEITSCELTVGRDSYSLGRASGTFQCLSCNAPRHMLRKLRLSLQLKRF